MNRNVYRVGMGWWLPFVLWLVFAGLVGYVMGGAMAHAQQTHPEWYTNGASNGRYWVDMAPPFKTFYLVGVRDGVDAGASDDKSGFTYKWWIPPETMTYNDLRDAVDKFYSEPANRPIPITIALSLIAGKARGTLTEKEAEERTMRFRSLAIWDAQHPEGLPAVPPPPATKEVKK